MGGRGGAERSRQRCCCLRSNEQAKLQTVNNLVSYRASGINGRVSDVGDQSPITVFPMVINWRSKARSRGITGNLGHTKPVISNNCGLALQFGNDSTVTFTKGFQMNMFRTVLGFSVALVIAFWSSQVVAQQGCGGAVVSGPALGHSVEVAGSCAGPVYQTGIEWDAQCAMDAARQFQACKAAGGRRLMCAAGAGFSYFLCSGSSFSNTAFGVKSRRTPVRNVLGGLKVARKARCR